MNVLMTACAAVTAVLVTAHDGPDSSFAAEFGGGTLTAPSVSKTATIACLFGDSTIARYGLELLTQEPASATAELPPVEPLTSAASTGWCSTETADACSIMNEQHGTCTARNNSTSWCSTKGTSTSSKCSVVKGHSGKSSECSVTVSSGYNCSVLDRGSTPKGTCSVFSRTGAVGGNKCSTLAGAASTPQCSVIEGEQGDNQGKCSIHVSESSGSGENTHSTCSSYQASSRCSVTHDSGGQCTAYTGSGSRCSVQGAGQCSVLLPNGGFVPKEGTKCDG